MSLPLICLFAFWIIRDVFCIRLGFEWQTCVLVLCIQCVCYQKKIKYGETKLISAVGGSVLCVKLRTKKRNNCFSKNSLCFSVFPFFFLYHCLLYLLCVSNVFFSSAAFNINTHHKNAIWLRAQNCAVVRTIIFWTDGEYSITVYTYSIISMNLVSIRNDESYVEKKST